MQSVISEKYKREIEQLKKNYDRMIGLEKMNAYKEKEKL